jgi:hypothetical protein
MNPRGSAPLLAMRQAGQRPAAPVWITYGDFRDPDWWRWTHSADKPELLVRPEDPIERLDLRCVVGLNVVLFFPDWSAAVSRLYERLQEYAREIAVMSPGFEADIGWRWTKAAGQHDFCQPERRAA